MIHDSTTRILSTPNYSCVGVTATTFSSFLAQTMGRYFELLLFSLLLGGFVQGSDDADFRNDAAFSQFLNSTMYNYANWLIDNNLDPSLSYPGPADISFRNNLVEMDCQIFDFYVKGISKEVLVEGPNSWMAMARFGFTLDISPDDDDYIVFGGKYRANGTLNSSIPFAAEGNWELIEQSIKQRLQIEGYEITPDGYVDITVAPNRTMTSTVSSLEPFVSLNFQGLLTDKVWQAWGRVVEDGLMDSFFRFFNSNDSYPYPSLDSVFNYLDQVFSSTPLEEIINGTSILETEKTSTSRNHQQAKLDRNISAQMENLSETQRQENLRFSAFLFLTLGRYPNWLAQNGLDPSEPLPGPALIQVRNNVIELDCEISDYYVKGLSTQISQIYPYGSIANAEFDASFYLSNTNPNYVVIGGKYKANGTALSTTPLAGEGDWEFVLHRLSQMIFVKGFVITQDEHIDIKPATIDFHSFIPFVEPRYVTANFRGSLFEGEVAQGWKRVVEDGLFKSFDEFFRSNISYPYPSLGSLYTFLDEVFSSTPLEQIIGPTTT